MDTIHAFSYGDSIHVLAYRRHDEPALEPEPELANSVSCAAEAVERTFARLEERRRKAAIVAKQNRKDLRSMRQIGKSERGEALLDYNTALDLDLAWFRANPIPPEPTTTQPTFVGWRHSHDPRKEQQWI